MLRIRAAVGLCPQPTHHPLQAGALCDPYAFSGFLHCLKRACLPVGGAAGRAGEGGTQATQADDGVAAAAAGDVAPPGLALACLDDLAAFLRCHSMRGNDEMISLLLDMAMDLTGSAVVGTAPAQAQRGGGGRRGGAGAAAAAAAAAAGSGASHHATQQGTGSACHAMPV